MMKLMDRMANSIGGKLFVPLFLVFVVATGLFYLVARYHTDSMVHKHLQNRAFELAESFAVATEINTSHSNFVRVINSIGAYEDTGTLFLLDDESATIIASSKNRYAKANLNDLHEPPLKASLLSAIAIDHHRFLVQKSDHELNAFVYKFGVVVANERSLRRMTLYIEIDNSSSHVYVNSINRYFFTVLIALLTVIGLISLFFIRNIVLSPIYKLVDSIQQTKKQGKPIVSRHRSRDQLGVLTRVYNELIIDNFNQQQQLKDERERSERALLAKQQFLAMMTHELRTPLNGVIGMSGQLAAIVNEPQQHKYVQVIQLSARQLLAIINDTLDFSKIEANKLELDIQPFDLMETVANVISMFELKLQNTQVQLNFHQPAQAIPILEGDSVRIIQVVINLLANAVKFTEQGTIDVTVGIGSENEEALSFHISVADSGIGLSADQIDSLFNEFTQADSSTTRKYGGTGLGLWICKNLVEKMAGEINVTGELGKGAEFVVHLTLKKSTLSTVTTAVVTEQVHNRTNQKVVKLLLVDDTEINRMVVEAILSEANYQFTIAENGVEAVEQFKLSLSDDAEPFGAILMDCLMPIMDGFEACQQIRQIEQQNAVTSAIPIIALTANSLDETRQQCLAAGMDEFLTKPIEAECLQQMVIKCLGQGSSASALPKLEQS